MEVDEVTSPIQMLPREGIDGTAVVKVWPAINTVAKVAQMTILLGLDIAVALAEQ